MNLFINEIYSYTIKLIYASIGELLLNDCITYMKVMYLYKEQ